MTKKDLKEENNTEVKENKTATNTNANTNANTNPKQKEFFFLGGLPRSGSTLLCNILAQNPKFQTGGASGVMDVMFMIRNNWDNLIEFKANPNEAGKLRVMRGVLENFYADSDKSVVIDKCRGWISVIEMIEEVLGHKAKIIVPVRDVRDVLASFEKLWRKNPTRQNETEKANYWKYQTVEGRVEVMLQNNQPIGLAYNRVKDVISRNLTDRILLVDYDKLTREPEEQMKRIYKFLGQEYYRHDFNNVEQVIWEKDSVYGFKNLHDIRMKIEPQESQWPAVLGNFAEKYGKLNFWEKLT